MNRSNKNEKNIAVLCPELIKEWDYQKNSIMPQNVTQGSKIKAWWLCSRGHSYQARISHRVYSKSGCPYCSGNKILVGFNDLQTTHPELCQEWDYLKNTISPTEVSKGSSRFKVWWICPKGHSYQDTIAHRSGKDNRGCPYCSNHKIIRDENSLAKLAPYILNEWDFDKNKILPSQITHKSGKKVWWICSNGHSYNAIVANKIRLHSGCPYCAGLKVLIGFNDLASLEPELCKEWGSKNDKTPFEYVKYSNKKVWWKCIKCEYEWKASPNDRVDSGRGCPKCSSSKGEKQVSNILDNLQIEYAPQKRFPECKNKKTLPFDFYIPSLNLCIEYQGQQHYGKSNGKQFDFEKIQLHDQIKRDFCKSNNIHLLEISYADFNNIEQILHKALIPPNVSVVYNSYEKFFHRSRPCHSIRE